MSVDAQRYLHTVLSRTPDTITQTCEGSVALVLLYILLQRTEKYSTCTYAVKPSYHSYTLSQSSYILFQGENVSSLIGFSALASAKPLART
jgi:hypothetical protein